MNTSVGIDVPKDQLVVALAPSHDSWSVSNDDQGITDLVERLGAQAVQLVVLEATGHWELPAAAALAAAGLPVVIANPREVRDFAKATKRLAKTDAVDAVVLAEYAQRVQPEVRPLPDEDTLALRALVARRRQIVAMLTAEKNRLPVANVRVRPSIQTTIAALQRVLKELDDDIASTIRSSPLWHAKDRLYRSMGGVGRVLSSTLIADLPELGTLSPKQVGALVGVVPFNRDSGLWRGRRTIWGGRTHLRSVLFMATIVAVRCNPDIQHFYQRLLSSGKPRMLALTAAMHKVLTVLNAMAHTSTPWQSQLLALDNSDSC